jgi:hypothetical protein
MRLLVCVLALALSAAPGFSEPKAPVLPNQGLEIVQRFGGMAKMVVSDTMESKEPAPLIIQDQDAFQKFTALLPPTLTEIFKTSPAGPNPDPLVKTPKIDWSRYMLLVVFDSQSLSFPPNINRVEVQNNQLVAVVEFPDTKFVETHPPDFGAYGAALVVRSDKTLQWSNPGHRAQEAQRESMMMFLPDAK